MGIKINRIGEKNINNFGNEMIIIEYRGCHNIDVYFPKYNYIAKNKEYKNFKKGEIKYPYEKRYYGIGYFGEGKYKTRKNGKLTKCYNAWKNMLQRCYDEEWQEKHPTYKGCIVCDEWHNFQNFAKWYEENYYEIEREKIHLDKDILVKGNKIYSPETCIFVPQTINSLFVKNNENRGDSVIGTYFRNDKYEVYCHIINTEIKKSKQEYLGTYETQEEAFEVYKYYKEKNIKEVANYYKDLIPQRLYKGMYNYEVKIDD